MKFIIGKKVAMTQIWQDDKAVAVTKIQAGPCVVVQVKDNKKDGYEAVQLGFGEKKAKNLAKPQLGHFKKTGKNFSVTREFRLDRKGRETKAELGVGDVISASTFAAGDIVQFVGTSKGKGFQGVVKRHHFAGGRKSHGNKDQLRMPGSIGNVGAGHVWRGTRMAGRMGGDRVTVKNVEIIEVDEQNGFIYLKGAVAGARNGLILIEGQGDLKISRPEAKPAEAKVEADEAPKAEEKK